MKLKVITLLTEEEYLKYKSIIPNMDLTWWLRTPYGHTCDFLCVVSRCHHVSFSWLNETEGVRPFCVFSIEPVDLAFWQQPDTLVGSKIKFGKYMWTILDIKNDELYALCNECIARCRWSEHMDWEKSELKDWLETEGLKLITI